MSLNEFIKQIFDNPPPTDISVEEKTQWIYQNHFCRTSSLRKQGSHEIPAFAGMTTNINQQKFLETIARKSEKLTTWIDVNVFEKKNDEIMTTLQGLNIKAGRGEWRLHHKKTQVRWPHFILGDDRWFRCSFQDDVGKNKKATARLYLNIIPHAVPHVIEECQLFMKLTPENIISIKMATDLEYYELRRDPCVIYFQKKKKPHVPFILRPLIQKIRKRKMFLDENMPLTYSLEPGVSYAEEPSEDGISFGMHRCRVIAQGLENQTKTMNSNDWIQIIHEEWLAQGLSLDEPWRSS